MVIITNSKNDISGEDIRITLNVLKKHISQYDVAEKCMNSKEDLTRSRRIEELVMEEKHLSQQFHHIRKEIRRYERKYEKILKKKVKLMSIQIKDDLYRLNTLKQKYNELNVQISKKCYKNKEDIRENSKKVCKVQGTKRGLRKFKQKSVPFNRKIKIKIKRNEKLGRREMLFVNDSNAQQSVNKLVTVAKPASLNTRECKIMLEKLTEEQVNQIIQQRQNQQTNKQTNKQTPANSPQNNNESETVDKPNWHIKIPKSVFEEIQKENRSSEINIASPVRNVTTRQSLSSSN